MTAAGRPPRVAIVWTQFIPVHVDRLIALHERLHGQVRVEAIEVASSSLDYGAFAPTGPIGPIARTTLFPGKAYDLVPGLRRFWKLLRVLIGAQLICIGIPYSRPEVLPLVLALRLLGSRVVIIYDSKFDDKPRRAWFEFVKRLGLLVYSGAIVAGPRSRQYLRFLGFKRRPIVVGANSLSIARIRAEADAGQSAERPPFTRRDFVYVGRFVAVKNLSVLIEGFAQFVRRVPDQSRRLVMIGSGPEEAQLRATAELLGIGDRVIFPGFLTGPTLTGAMAESLALVLPSSSEPWGLVINEAIALGLPVITSEAPGARDLLARHLINGCVFETGSPASLGRAMAHVAADEAQWRAMCAASSARAWLADADRFVDAVEVLLDPAAEPAATRIAQVEAAFDLPFDEGRVFLEGMIGAVGHNLGWRRATG